MSDRWFVVVIEEQPDAPTRFSALSRPLPDGTWQLLTEEEAGEIAGAWNADEREGGEAHVVEVFVYDRDRHDDPRPRLRSV